MGFFLQVTEHGKGNPPADSLEKAQCIDEPDGERDDGSKCLDTDPCFDSEESNEHDRRQGNPNDSQQRACLVEVRVGDRTAMADEKSDQPELAHCVEVRLHAEDADIHAVVLRADCTREEPDTEQMDGQAETMPPGKKGPALECSATQICRSTLWRCVLWGGAFRLP